MSENVLILFEAEQRWEDEGFISLKLFRSA